MKNKATWSVLVLALAPLLAGAAMIVAPFAARYHARSAVFDGTNDYMRLTSNGPTGLSDSKQFTLSCWVNLFSGGDGNNEKLLNFATSTSSTRLQVEREGLVNTVTVFARNAAGSTVINLASDIHIDGATGWHHVYVCIDTADAAKRKVYVDGQLATLTVDTWVDDTIDQVVGTSGRYSIGTGSSANERLTGEMAEWWFDDTYLDAPAAFRDPDNKPKFLGADGSLPKGGTAPVFYLRGGGEGFNVNSGTAPNFTTTGALTEGSRP